MKTKKFKWLQPKPPLGPLVDRSHAKGSDIPLRATMCSTCPWRKGSPYADLVPSLTDSAIREASRICHSTGTNAIHKRTGKKPHLCRGAREVQLNFMHALKQIEAPTDEAWNKRRRELGMTPTVIKDP